MSDFTFKYQMYKSLQENIPNIYEDLRKEANEIGIPHDLKGRFGLTGAISGCPAPLRKDIMEAGEKTATQVIPLKNMVDEIREIVKSVYGDEYDAAPLSTCEAGLWVSFDSLCTPPMQGRGDNYRTRYIAPYEKHLHHQGSYGRPYPPKYKDIFADRGSTSGELGFAGKRQENMDAVIVPLVGANYDVHGIKYHPVPLLSEVDAEASGKRISDIVQMHQNMVTGFTSLGYDTPGYGYKDKDADGTPVLQKKIAEEAHKLNVPYIIDNAWGIPFVGTDIRKTGADVMIFSMDKATGAPTSGLIIGKEDVMVSIRRALGMHGERWGTPNSYGKAAYVGFDPGKEALAGQIAALQVLRDQPDVLKQPVDDMFEIIKDEFSKIHPDLQKGIIISKTYNSTAIEVNYEGTWSEGHMGIPIFTIEDMYSGTNLFQSGLAQMGIIPTVAYDANIFISPGLGTTDEHGQVVEEKARKAVRGLVRTMEIVSEYAGII